MTGKTNRAYKTLEKDFTEALALAILNFAKPFVLYMLERTGVAVAILSQKLETETHPVAYLSKDTRWDSLRSARMSESNSCYCPVSGRANEDNPTLGQQLEVLTPHQVRATLG
jgi:hypothetical protein